MKKYYIEIAGLVIGIEHEYDYVEEICRDFRVDGNNRKADFVVRASREAVFSRRERAMAKGRRIYPLWYYENEVVHREICRRLPEYDGLFIHSALLSVQGKGIGFIAGVQGGKTTQIRLWQKVLGDRVLVLNGDKPVYRRMEDGRIWGFGTPWKGKEALGTDGMVPLQALCFIRKAEENRLIRLDEAGILKRLFYHLELPDYEEETEPVSRMLADLIRRVPFYELSCDKTPAAVETAQAMLSYQ